MFANLLGEVKGKVVDFITRKCKRNFALSTFKLLNSLVPKALGYRTCKFCRLSRLSVMCQYCLIYSPTKPIDPLDTNLISSHQR